MEFIDLKAQYEVYKDEIIEAVINVMSGTHFIIGDEVNLFENDLARYIGRKYAISCSDGTAALQLAYMVYGIGSGDAVFCPDMTFIASIEPACLLGATPVFCDIDKDSYNINVESLERQINNVINEGKLKPKAIVAVDFLGNPVNYEQIEMIAKKYNLVLIEDGAQGTGGSIGNKKLGSFGDISTTSFFPTKPLGCYGDGGAVFTDDIDICEKIRSLRVHGKGKTKYDNIYIGINSRLDEIQAAILNIKLKYLENEIERRQIIAKKYDDEIKELVGVPKIREDAISAYAQYIITLKDSKERDSLMRYLKENEIPTIQYYPNPIHKLPVFKKINTYGELFENANWYADCSMGIPFAAFLREEEQAKIIDTIKSFFQ